MAESAVETINPCRDTCTLLCANSDAADCQTSCDATFCAEKVTATSNYGALYFVFAFSLFAALVILAAFQLRRGQKGTYDVHPYQRI